MKTNPSRGDGGRYLVIVQGVFLDEGLDKLLRSDVTESLLGKETENGVKQLDSESILHLSSPPKSAPFLIGSLSDITAAVMRIDSSSPVLCG